MINTITLNPSIDKYVAVPKLVKDDTLRATALHQDPGGKGINVSRVLQELGSRTSAYGLIGGAPGKMLQAYMQERGIPFHVSEVEGETRINVMISDASDGSQTRISVPGPRVKARDFDRLMRKIKSAKPKPTFWVMGGSVPKDLPTSIYRTIITQLQADGIPCILDADDDALDLGVKAKPYMIKPNEFEMQRLLKTPLRTLGDCVRATRIMVSKGISIVVLSLGKRGMVVASRDEVVYANGPKVEAKSKVGAGDSSVAGMVHALALKKSLLESARWSVAAGTAAVLTEGTRLCRHEDIARILPQVRVVRIPD